MSLFFVRHRLELAVFCGCAALLVYIGWQSFLGPHSRDYRTTLVQHLAAAQKANEAIVAQRVALETRVTMMRPNTVDADLLEELARERLHMGRAQDVVIRLAQ